MTSRMLPSYADWLAKGALNKKDKDILSVWVQVRGKINNSSKTNNILATWVSDTKGR